MKRVAILAHGLSGGGAERVAALVANGLAAKGYPVLFVAVYSGAKEHPLDPSVEYRYLDVSGSKLKKYIDRTKLADKTLRSFGAEVAVSFVTRDLLLTNLRKTCPLIYSPRCDPGRVTGLDKTVRDFSYSRAQRIVFQTEGAMQCFSAKIRDKGVVIANPLTQDLPLWDSAGHNNTVISACRLEEQKNVPMLIRAFAKFHERFPAYDLKVYGKGPLLEELKNLCKELQVSDCVQFPGYSTDIHRIMAESAMFVLSSDYEGLSNSMLEALAVGVPAVCTDCPPGGAREYIEDGKSGCLVDVGDTEALFEAMCALAQDSALCVRISKEEQKIRTKLRADVIIDKWEKAVADF